MEFFVIFPDGRSFGPADVPTLAQWAKEGRLLPNTMLESLASRERMAAGSVAGIFPAQAPGPSGYAPLPGENPYAPQTSGYLRADPRYQNYAPPINGMAITSLVLGILSLVLFCLWIIAIPLGLVGLIFGVVGNKDNSKSIAVAGIVCSVVGMIISVGFVILIMSNGGSRFWMR